MEGSGTLVGGGWSVEMLYAGCLVINKVMLYKVIKLIFKKHNSWAPERWYSE